MSFVHASYSHGEISYIQNKKSAGHINVLYVVVIIIDDRHLETATSAQTNI